MLEPPKTAYLPIFVGRQTIFDAGLNIWGHELLFRSGGKDKFADFKDADQATAAVITEGFSIATDSLPKGRKILINYPQELLLKKAPLPLEKDLNAALLGEKNDLRQWIDLSIAVERGDWSNLDFLLRTFRLDEQQTAIKHIHAADWAVKMLVFRGAEETHGTG